MPAGAGEIAEVSERAIAALAITLDRNRSHGEMDSVHTTVVELCNTDSVRGDVGGTDARECIGIDRSGSEIVWPCSFVPHFTSWLPIQ